MDNTNELFVVKSTCQWSWAVQLSQSDEGRLIAAFRSDIPAKTGNPLLSKEARLQVSLSWGAGLQHMAGRAYNSHHTRSADTHSDARQLPHMQPHRTCSAPTKDSHPAPTWQLNTDEERERAVDTAQSSNSTAGQYTYTRSKSQLPACRHTRKRHRGRSSPLPVQILPQRPAAAPGVQSYTATSATATLPGFPN